MGFFLTVGFRRALVGRDMDYELKLCMDWIKRCNKRFNMDGCAYMREHKEDVMRIGDEIFANIMREKRCSNCKHFVISGCSKHPDMQFPKRLPCDDWSR